MAAIVNIDQPLTELSLKEGERRSLGFDLVNVAERSLHVTVTTTPEPGKSDTVPAWIKLTGEPTFRLGPKETRKVELEVGPPKGTAATGTGFRLKVFEISLPEENNSFSEPVQVTVEAAAPEESGNKPPWKLISAIAAALLLLIVVGGGWLASGWLNQATLPDVEGRPLAEAIADLEEAGIARSEISEERPIQRDADGTVTAQSPVAGTKIEESTVVTLRVPRPPEMPDVEGRPLAEAIAALEEAGIARSEISEERPIQRDADGTVTAQSPAAGTTVMSGQQVAVTIPQVPRMPDVQGRLLAQALTTLEQAGIPPSVVTINEPIDSENIGRVTKQSPDPQAAITAGTSVALTVPQRPRDCPARTVSFNHSGIAYVHFDLPTTPIGNTKTYKDGRYWVGAGLRCYSLTWSNVRFSCVSDGQSDGRWLDSKTITREAWCHGESNTDQPGMRVEKR